MRIAHIVDYFHTDLGYQEFYLARDQGLAGHDVLVVASPFRHHLVSTVGPDEKRGEQSLIAARVALTRIPAIQMGHDRAWLRRFSQILDSFRPDVIHCHGPFSPTTVRCARYGRRKKIGVLVDNHMGEHNSPAAATLVARSVYRSYNALFGRVLRKAIGTWVAIGPEEADFLTRRLSVPPSAIRLISLGFDDEVFSYDAERRRRLRFERGWVNETVVAVTGKLYGDKRVDVVAAACGRATRDLNVRLVVAGSISPPLLQLVTEQAERLIELGRLTVLPMLPKSELADLYLSSDIVVFPKPSISAFEAAGTGALVLLGRDPYAEWIASLSRQFRPFELHRLDLRAFTFDGDRQAAANNVRRVFSWPIISQKFIKEYEELI